MIAIDGKCYRATEDGTVVEAGDDRGVPFSTVAFMDGINASGWHLHFISEDRTVGGHVYEIKMEQGLVRLAKKNSLEIQLPRDAAFDTYSLKTASKKEIEQVEQGGK